MDRPALEEDQEQDKEKIEKHKMERLAQNWRKSGKMHNFLVGDCFSSHLLTSLPSEWWIIRRINSKATWRMGQIRWFTSRFTKKMNCLGGTSETLGLVFPDLLIFPDFSKFAKFATSSVQLVLDHGN
jgi:hypothetical protein